jgi:ABC-type amino acid transport substrate-binding protein/mono/diheme cytochrome c family protein
MKKALVCLAALASLSAGAQTPGTLRVCADPDNLPFSKAEGPERGLYIDVAERVAQKLGRRVEYVWYASSYQRRALRNTIQANECDAWFALPADAEYRARGLQKSVGIVHVGYAVVAPPGFAFAKLEDLKGRRVAVSFASTPAVLLSSIEGVTLVTERTAEAALDSLARGDADVAFVWGPSAGYDIDRRFKGRWQMVSVTGHGLGGAVSAAVRRDQPELLKSIDRELEQMRPDIDALARKYGFPLGKPVELEKSSALALSTLHAHQAREAAAWIGPTPTLALVADAPAAGASKPQARKAPAKPAAKDAAKAAAAATAAPAAAAAPADPLVAGGREKFNDVCSHCHSPDGASPMRERDLRRMKMRYDDKWTDMAVKTINEGRPQLGMPTWKGQVTDAEIEKIVAFLKTIQK